MPVLVPRHGVLRPHATVIINDPALPHEVQIDLLQCVHCQVNWMVEPGSGRQRGFCTRCSGPTCGPRCDECRGPIEKRIELYEAGKLAAL